MALDDNANVNLAGSRMISYGKWILLASTSGAGSTLSLSPYILGRQPQSCSAAIDSWSQAPSPSNFTMSGEYLEAEEMPQWTTTSGQISLLEEYTNVWKRYEGIPRLYNIARFLHYRSEGISHLSRPAINWTKRASQRYKISDARPGLLLYSEDDGRTAVCLTAEEVRRLLQVRHDAHGHFAALITIDAIGAVIQTATNAPILNGVIPQEPFRAHLNRSLKRISRPLKFPTGPFKILSIDYGPIPSNCFNPFLRNACCTPSKRRLTLARANACTLSRKSGTRRYRRVGEPDHTCKRSSALALSLGNRGEHFHTLSL